MCLLIALSRMWPEAPLVVGANRDEAYDRPAVPMAVLEDAPVRILGGRDELAGGTWLAVNEAGVVAGLTNRPVDGGRDPSKRSRGELPLRAAGCATASAAAERLAEVDPTAYNPAWMLVGDATGLFAVDLADEHGVRVAALPPGVHVLENSAHGSGSAKERHVRRLLAGIEDAAPHDAPGRLAEVLRNHEIPDVPGGSGDDEAPAPVRAPCVHSEHYGTRWSCLVTVGAPARVAPELRYANGPPCGSTFVDASPLWDSRK